MTFPKSLDRGRGTWCLLTSWNRTHDCWSPTDKTFCGRGTLSLQQPHLNAASQFKVFYYLGSKKKAGVQMGEFVTHWLVFCDQGSQRSSTKPPARKHIGVVPSSVTPLALKGFQKTMSGSYLSVSPLCPFLVSKESRALASLRRKHACVCMRMPSINPSFIEESRLIISRTSKVTSIAM